jgi:CRP-like cAMP-binding protein
MTLTSSEIALLGRNPLFKGMSPSSIAKALYCLRARKESFEADSFLFEEGDPAQSMKILLEGQVDLLRYDEDGHMTILESFGPGESFGEVYAITSGASYGVNALAKGQGSALSLEVAPLYDEMGCPFGKILFKNLVDDLAKKDLLLKEKVMILSQKGLENKLLRFLESYAPKEGGSFLVPFSREEMASYLACERSALSRLISQMAQEGKIAYNGNRFRILKKS